MTRDALRSLLLGAFVAVQLFAPRAALACAVCTGGQKEEVGRAMLVGSIVLSVLPLLAVGAVAWWLRRRARAIATRDAAASTAQTATAASHARP